MSRFVRPSSYRHTYGQPAKKELTYDNIKISANAWDSNMVAASAKYLAVNYQASGGGAFMVVPLDRPGKVPDIYPLCRGHTAPVLDVAWSPFDDSIVASAGEDGKVCVTRVDDKVLSDAWSTEIEASDMEPHVRLNAHGRKAGNVMWHPTAGGVLASAGLEVKLWDVEAQQSKSQSETHPDMVQTMAFDYTGSVYATTCKDKKLRLFDPRGAPSAVAKVDSHTGVKASRVAWMGSLDNIVTTGFSRMSERQIWVWDSRNLTSGPVKTINVDTSAGILMPFWHDANKVLMVAGKGDGNVRLYEWTDGDLFYLNEHSSNQPQRGMCFLPTRALNTHEHEIARAFKCTGNTVEPISFIVPRKSEAFQADLYPAAPSSEPALSAAEFFAGKTAEPVLVDLENGKTAGGKTMTDTKSYDQPAAASQEKPNAALAPAPTPDVAPTPAPAPVKEEPKPAPAPVLESVPAPKSSPPPPAAAKSNGSISLVAEEQDELLTSLRDDNASLRDECARLREGVEERDHRIRNLELKLEKLSALKDALNEI